MVRHLGGSYLVKLQGRFRQVLPGLFALLVLALLAGLLLWLVDGSKDSRGRVIRTRPDVTLEHLVKRVSNRTAYIVCVDGAAGLTLRSEHVSKVRRALDEAFIALPHVPHDVTVGCPPPVGSTGRVRYLAAAEGPSQHVIAVYFVPTGIYHSWFEDAFPSYPYALTHEELACEGDVCHGLTEGLYVTPAITKDQLRHAFLDIEGLAPDPYEACTVGDADIYRAKGWVVDPGVSWCDEFWKAEGVAPPS